MNKCSFYFCNKEGDYKVNFPTKEYPVYYCKEHLAVLHNKIKHAAKKGSGAKLSEHYRDSRDNGGKKWSYLKGRTTY